MFARLLRKWSKKCAVCGGKAESPRNYLDDQGIPIKVCWKCVSYAERRAYRKR